MIVVDTNVVVTLVLPSEHTAVVTRLFELEPRWVGPRLVRSEILSVLAQQRVNAGLTVPESADAFSIALEAFDDASLEPEPARVLQLVVSSGCSSYDCEYVAVAEELGCRLATYDKLVLRRFPSVAATPDDLLSERT